MKCRYDRATMVQNYSRLAAFKTSPDDKVGGTSTDRECCKRAMQVELPTDHRQPWNSPASISDTTPMTMRRTSCSSLEVSSGAEFLVDVTGHRLTMHMIQGLRFLTRAH